MYKFILFDLDGTLTDPKIGITSSVHYALTKLGIKDIDLSSLTAFIGPPLQESFQLFYSFQPLQVQEAIHYYRERFVQKGIYENEMYSGIERLLDYLKTSGYTLIVATSKPTEFAVKIVEYFKIDHYFDMVVGSHLDGRRTSKAEIIQYILDSYGRETKTEFIMVGDRKHDIIGAHRCRIDSLAVLYGYGSEEELREVKPTYIARNVEEIKHLFT
ncbi:HAD family hydrolase [Alkalihalobacillus sp. LMS39]|uniref:HAD family hydrolase n=1 Tax=Alkalihalobacillus sp. LMS39 TaxID=2924032 RepID=UPI001FB1A549|nr:HAD family hydrolase [Alkalihalobacillus sp. LMS39]UOE96150.1 HAD family hydrolase [Alkalihalobacillus sp. LMS39]